MALYAAFMAVFHDIGMTRSTDAPTFPARRPTPRAWSSIMQRSGIEMKSKRMSAMGGSLVAICIVAAAMIAPASGASAETTLQRIQRTGEVRIGYANEAPFAYTTPDGT